MKITCRDHLNDHRELIQLKLISKNTTNQMEHLGILQKENALLRIQAQVARFLSQETMIKKDPPPLTTMGSNSSLSGIPAMLRNINSFLRKDHNMSHTMNDILRRSRKSKRARRKSENI